MSGGELELETQIAEDFQLGKPHGPLERAAEGWGGHNQVFRLATTAGVWAVKRHGRRPYADRATAFAIEATAHTAGVPMAPPVVTAAGHGWTEIGGVTFRCHGWIDGAAKQNEDTSGAEAEAMGRIVARLHRLRIPAPQPAPSPPVDPERWAELAGMGGGAPWACRLAETLGSVVTMATQPQPIERGRDELVGSHRDLNAHNVMFSATGLRLVDWEAAGPAWPRWERASFAVLWGSRVDGAYDDDRVVAFLRGYLDGGGVLDADDPSVLSAAPAALAPWVIENLELAVARPSDRQEELAAALVDALLAMPETAATRQAVLARCLERVTAGGECSTQP